MNNNNTRSYEREMLTTKQQQIKVGDNMVELCRPFIIGEDKSVYRTGVRTIYEFDAPRKPTKDHKFFKMK